MANLNVSLPDPVGDWIKEKVRSGEYESAEDYLVSLVRNDRGTQAREGEDESGLQVDHDDFDALMQRDEARRNALVAALIEGENSGTSRRTVADVIADGKAKLRRAPG